MHDTTLYYFMSSYENFYKIKKKKKKNINEPQAIFETKIFTNPLSKFFFYLSVVERELNMQTQSPRVGTK